MDEEGRRGKWDKGMWGKSDLLCCPEKRGEKEKGVYLKRKRQIKAIYMGYV